MIKKYENSYKAQGRFVVIDRVVYFHKIENNWNLHSKKIP